MHLVRAVFAVAIFLSSSAAAVGQDGTPNKHHARIKLKNGTTLEGTFAGATTDAIRIEQGAVESTVKLDAVESIAFGNAPIVAPTPATSTKNAEAVGATVRALRNLASATSVGVSFQEYGRLVIEAKAEVDTHLPNITNEEARRAASNSMVEYTFAAQVWNEYIRSYSRGGIPTKSELGRALVNRYGVPVKISVFTSISRDAALASIWRYARIHFEALETFAK